MNPRNPRYLKSGIKGNTLKDRNRKYPKTPKTPTYSGRLRTVIYSYATYAVDLACLAFYLLINRLEANYII